MKDTYVTIIRAWAKQNDYEITTAFLCQLFEKTYPSMTQEELIKLLEEMR